MKTSKTAPVKLAAKGVSTDVTNAPQRLAMLNNCDVGSKQWQIADIQAGLQEANNGEFASAEEVCAVFAKYGH